MQIENFTLQEYDFYGARTLFLTTPALDNTLIITGATFNLIPVFDYPVLVLSVSLPSPDNPDMVDTFAFSEVYLVKDGMVTQKLTDLENAAIFYEDPDSGFTMTSGETIARFDLITKGIGEEAKADLRERLLTINDWLIKHLS